MSLCSSLLSLSLSLSLSFTFAPQRLSLKRFSSAATHSDLPPLCWLFLNLSSFQAFVLFSVLASLSPLVSFTHKFSFSHTTATHTHTHTHTHNITALSSSHPPPSLPQRSPNIPLPNISPQPPDGRRPGAACAAPRPPRRVQGAL